MINKITLLGRVGKIDSKLLQSGKDVTNFSVATSEKYLDGQGVKQEKTTWHNCVVFGKLAIIARDYLQAGHIVYVEGKINHQEYVDNQQIKRHKTVVMVNEIKLLPQGGSKQNQQSNGNKPPQQAQQPFGLDDDIPF